MTQEMLAHGGARVGDTVLITSSGSGTSSITSDQSRAWVDASTKTMQRAGFYMREAIEKESVDDALRHAAVMLGELRTELLPSAYFSLWTQACGELAALEAFFGACDEYHYDYISLYNKVQSAGNVLPRLYLLFTVGSAVLKHLMAEHVEGGDPSMDALPVSISELLRDMEALCKGVQHPMRGLFLRTYLLQCGKLALGVDRGASTSFLLENFAEMNKLWVRMKYNERDVSRQQLADLVGKNLLYLAELVTLEEFQEDVLGKILEQVVSCRDSIAQTYLIECLTAVFPDEFQIATIDRMLAVLPELDPSVNMATVLGSMLDRLARYAQAESSGLEILDDMQLFEKISGAVEASIASHQEHISGEAIVSIYGGLLSFADAVYPGNMAYVEEIMGKCLARFSSGGAGDEAGKGSGSSADPAANKKIVSLLCIPLENYGLETLLKTGSFCSLVEILTPDKKRELAYKVATMMPARGELVRDAGSAKALITLLEPLYGINAAESDARVFARALESIRVDDPARRAQLVFDMVEGLTGRDDVVRWIAPAAVSSALDGVDIRKYPDETLVLLVGVCSRIADAGSGASAVGLLLDIVNAIGAAHEETAETPNHPSHVHVAFECMQQACILLEQAVYDSETCKSTLEEIIRTLPTADALLPDDSREMLHHKVGSYCSKLLLRHDQCRAMMALAHVEEDRPTVLARLHRAEHVIRAIQEQDAVFSRIRTTEQLAEPGKLLVELLEAYRYHMERGMEIPSEDVRRVTASAKAAAEGHPDIQAVLSRIRDTTVERKVTGV